MKEFLKKHAGHIIWFVVISCIIFGGKELLAKQKAARIAAVNYDIQKTAVTCPTLLSIARTSRDTLLVMRSEELCISYVLKTLE